MAGTDPTALWRLAHMGMELAGAVVVLALVGWWVDWQMGTTPWGVLTGTIIGLVGGMYLFIRRAMQANRQFQQKGPAERDRDDEP